MRCVSNATLACLLWSIIVMAGALEAAPVINEIMFHPLGRPAEDPAEEWLELYLPDNNKAVDLSGWQINRGVSFTFPEGTVMLPGSALVIAAHVETFHLHHPDHLGTVLGGWEGKLSNANESIRLEDASGKKVDEIDYATHGDWALRIRAAEVNRFEGWTWLNPADGEGFTYERLQPHFDINSGQIWRISVTEGGSPGEPTPDFTTDVAPVIQDLTHLPTIPRQGRTISITAKVTDDNAITPEVRLRWRVDGSTEYQSRDMTLERSGLYEASIPAQFNRTVIEYYVEASDGVNERTWPAKARTSPFDEEQNVSFQQVTNALLQVDDSFEKLTDNPGSQPVYRIIMTQAETALLEAAQRQSSGFNPVNAQFHATFISVDGDGEKVRHQCSIRDRGFSSRSSDPVNFHIAFPTDDRWNGRKAFQLNSRYPFSQAMGAAMFQRASVVTTEAVPVQVRFNGENIALRGNRPELNYGRYARAEPMNADWVERLYPNDADGNLYRADDHGRRGKELGYEGDDPDIYRQSYFKKTNEAADDYSDFINMTHVLSNAPAEGYRAAMEEVINVDQWLRFLAINSLIENREGGLGTGRSDDYGLYRGIKDPRFVLVPHDFDTVMSIGERNSGATGSIFIYKQVEGMRRMFEEPTIIRDYYRILQQMMADFFNSEHVDPLFDQLLGDWVPDELIMRGKQFVIDRRRNVMGQIPTTYEAFYGGQPVPENGAPLAFQLQSQTFTGSFHAIDVGSITINGELATQDYEMGTWRHSLDESSFGPGSTSVEIRFHADPSAQGEIVHRESFAIFRAGTLSEVTENIGEIGANPIIYRLITPRQYLPGLAFPVQVIAESAEGKWTHRPWSETVNLRTNRANIALTPATLALHQGTAAGSVVARPDGINGATTLLDSSTTWRFFEQRTFPPEDWKEVDFDDSSWTQGDGPMGFPPSPDVPGFVPPLQASTYFRTTLETSPSLPSISDFDVITMRLRYDDAAIVWINGQEALRTLGLEGPVNHETRSTINRVGVPDTFENFVIDTSLFAEGSNLIAVELHQSEEYDPTNVFLGDAGDLILDMQLLGSSTSDVAADFEMIASVNGMNISKTLQQSTTEPVARSGLLSGNLRWDGEVRVIDDVIIDASSQLTIAAGTQVLVAPDKQIIVEGSLRVNGTAEAPVVITNASPMAPWGGIVHRLNVSSYAHALISGADTAVTVEDTTATLRDSWIQDSARGIAVFGLDGRGTLSDCHLSGVSIGITMDRASMSVENSSIAAGEVGISQTGSTSTFQGSIVSGRDVAIQLDSSVINISTSTVHTSATGFHLSGEAPAAFLTESLLDECDIGFDVTTGKIIADHLTLVNGTTGIRLPATSRAEISNSILEATVAIDGEATIDHTMIADDDSPLPAGEGNLLGAPRFVDAEGRNYALTAESPARGAGTMASDSGAFPYVEPENVAPAQARWTLSDSPILIRKDTEITAEQTLIIDPGVSVYFSSGAKLTVNGVLRVLGTENQRVQFSHWPGAADEDDPLLPGEQLGPPKWGGIRFVDSLSSENLIQYADFVNAQPTDNLGSIGVIRSECFIDHCSFSGTHYRMLYGRNCSLTVQHCIFPDMFADDENPVAIGLDNVAEQFKVEAPSMGEDPRFVDGFPVGGHFRVYHNDFYGNKGHNDVMDVNSGRWGVSPILDCRYNHFHGPVGDEHMDLGGDAYVASNIFERGTKDLFTSDRGYSNAISTGDRGGQTTIVVARNLFRDLDHAINCKTNTATIFEHNVCLDFNRDYLYESGNVRQEVKTSAVNLFIADDFAPNPGDGAYLGYNIFFRSKPLADDTLPVGFQRLVSGADQDRLGRPLRTSQLQLDHNVIDPLLIDSTIGPRHPGGIFDARWGTNNVTSGPSGWDLQGNTIPEWAYVSASVVSSQSAEFTIGGAGIFAYRWRLNESPWSAPQPIGQPVFSREAPTVRTAVLVLDNLTEGDQVLEVIGQDFVGNWQPEEIATRQAWTTRRGGVQLHEIQAAGGEAIELYHAGSEPVDLTGWHLSERADGGGNAYTFPAGSSLDAGAFLVVAEAESGIQLDADGDALYLWQDETLVDSIEFGPQLTTHTIGRVGNDWQLTLPSLGEGNKAQPLGSINQVSIHEFLASGDLRFSDDWIELANAGDLPAALGGCQLSDNPAGDPNAHVFPPLSFIAAHGYLKLIADGRRESGHVNFSLDAQGERLSLTNAEGEEIDWLLFGPQTADYSAIKSGVHLLSYDGLPTDGFEADQAARNKAQALLDQLRITELHVDPLNGSDFEFVELTNVGGTTLDLTGVRFTNGIDFVFGESSLIAGASVVIVKNRLRFEERYGRDRVPIAGEYSGKLNNGGESLTLRLAEPFGAAILDFSYRPERTALIAGHSLQYIGATNALDARDDANWQGSSSLHGSPAGFIALDTPDPPLIAEGYPTWAAMLGVETPHDDIDGDGLASLIEYALDTDPMVATAPPITIDLANGVVLIELGTMRSDLKLTVEGSADLRNWQTLAEREGDQDWPEPAVEEDATNERRLVTVPLQDFITLVRLRVSVR